MRTAALPAISMSIALLRRSLGIFRNARFLFLSLLVLLILFEEEIRFCEARKTDLTRKARRTEK